MFRSLVMLGIWSVAGLFLVILLTPAPKSEPKFTVAVPYKAAFEELKGTDLEAIDADRQLSSRIEPATRQKQIDDKKQELIGRITLHSIQGGDKIITDDLGPKNVNLSNHRVLVLPASSSLDGLRPKDEIDLYLVPQPSKITSTTPTADAVEADTAQPQQEAESLILTDTLVLKIGKSGEDGSLPLLIAVPNNDSNLEALRRRVGRSVAYPMYVRPETQKQ